MCLPAPVLLPDAEGSTPLLGELPLRLAERDGLGLGVPALREIPETLAALAPHDGDLPATVQELQHPGQLSASAPPDVALLRTGRAVLELAREERPAAFQ